MVFNTWQVVKEWAKYCTALHCSMCPIRLRTKPIFRIFRILKIYRIMPFCNLFK